MFLRTWRFITIMLAALLMGMTFAHALEMPMKMKVDGPLWLTFQHNLYAYFAIIGAPIEIGAIVTAIMLAVLVRNSRRSFVRFDFGDTLIFNRSRVFINIIDGPGGPGTEEARTHFNRETQGHSDLWIRG